MNENQCNALWTAAASGDDFRIRQLLSHNTNPNDAVESLGYTALMAASFNGHIGAVDLLVNNGANVNAATDFGNTALMSAAMMGHEEVVDLLMRRQAYANARIKTTGYTALMFAAENGHDDSVSILLYYGADMRIKNIDGKSAIDLAYTKRIRDRLIAAKRHFQV